MAPSPGSPHKHLETPNRDEISIMSYPNSGDFHLLVIPANGQEAASVTLGAVEMIRLARLLCEAVTGD